MTNTTALLDSFVLNGSGFFVHIHSVEEVQQQVLKYINVIARPMILDSSEPPPTWTHANIDYTVSYFTHLSSKCYLPKLSHPLIR